MNSFSLFMISIFFLAPMGHLSAQESHEALRIQVNVEALTYTHPTIQDVIIVDDTGNLFCQVRNQKLPKTSATPVRFVCENEVFEVEVIWYQDAQGQKRFVFTLFEPGDDAMIAMANAMAPSAVNRQNSGRIQDASIAQEQKRVYDLR